MKKILLLLTPLFFLQGCKTAQQIRQEELATYRQQCLDYGFRYGTTDFARCMQDVEHREELKEEEARRRRAEEAERMRQYQERQRLYDSIESLTNQALKNKK